jgi:hypothetical protein
LDVTVLFRHKSMLLAEYFVTPAFVEGLRKPLKAMAKVMEKASDIGEDRITDRDALGIDVQDLSLTVPGFQTLAATEAVALSRDTLEI